MLALVLTSACGPTPVSAPSPATETRPPATVTVPFEMPVVISLAGAFDDPTVAVLYEQIAAFEAANADVRVEILGASRDADRRQGAFAASLAGNETAIDILAVNPHWLTGYARPGWLRPLEGDLAAAGVDPDAFLPALLAASTVDGRLVALPWVADGGLLYYRRDLLGAAGHSPPATWTALEAMAVELRGDGQPAHGFVWQGDEYDGLTCNALEQVWAAGGDVLDARGRVVVDSPATRAAFDQMAHYLAAGASPAAVLAYQEGGTLADFGSGNAVFMRNWSYAWHRLEAPGSPVRGQVGIAPLPASCLGGQSLVLSARSPYAEQAIRFMAFLTAPEQQAQLALRGLQAPALQAVYQDPAVLAQQPHLAQLFPALLAARPRPQAADYARFSEAFYTEVHRLLEGTQDATAAARNLQARLEELLAEE